MILSHLFLAVESGAITTPLCPDGSASTTNQQYLRELLMQMFSASFPNLTQPQLASAIQAMFENCKDPAAFKQNLRDFLVQLKEFGDSAELYADERQVRPVISIRPEPLFSSLIMYSYFRAFADALSGGPRQQSFRATEKARGGTWDNQSARASGRRHGYVDQILHRVLC